MAFLLIAVDAYGQQRDNYRSLLSDQHVRITETNLPIIFITVDDQMILRDRYVLGHMKVIHNGDGQLNYGDTIDHPGQHIDYEGPIAIKYRGNSSFDSADKKPYQIRTLKSDLLPDDGGEKQKVSILGMPKDNKWMFIAPWGDKVMFRDILSFELARPWMDFVPTVKLCEVFLDGIYYGVFGFGERVSKGKGRLDLHDPGADEGDLTGDYHVEVDRPEESYYTSRYRPWADLEGTEKRNFSIYYQHKEPEQDDWATLPRQARQQLNQLIDQMESSFRTSYYADPDEGYRKYINETSFIDYMLSTEVSNNIDNYRLSTHLYKYSDTRARNEGLDPRWHTAIWDYNLSWGNANYNNGPRTDTWVWQLNTWSNDGYQVPFYWYQMMNDETYVEHLKARWKQYREGNHSNARLMHTIDSLATMLTSHGAVERNQQAWQIIGRYGWPNYYIGQTYEEDLNYLKQWAKARLRFLDDALLPREPSNTEPIMPEDGWNADVVVEELPAADYSTQSIDANRTFYSERLKIDGGLPENRTVVSNAQNITYQLAPFNRWNAVSFHQQGDEAVLTFPAFRTNKVWMLATSGGGKGQVGITLHYSDGTIEEEQLVDIRDFSVPNPDGSEAITGLGNINRETNAFNSGTCHSGMFDVSIFADSSKEILGISMVSMNSAFPTILAFAYQVVEPPSAITVNEQTTDAQPAGIYDMQGRRLEELRPGVNIIRKDDGSVRKVLVR